MKKSVKITLTIILSICFIVSSCFGLFFWLKNRKWHKDEDFLEVSALSAQYTTFSQAFDKSNFKLSTNSAQNIEVATDVKENTILNYATKLKNDDKTSITVDVFERVDSMGNMCEDISINGVIYGTIGYNANGYLHSNTFNHNNIYYEYENDNISNLQINGIEYTYNYSDKKLSNVELDDDLFATFSYSEYGKISKEIYPIYSRMFEHTNVATIESAYDYDSATKIIAKLYDYVNDTPYDITTEKIALEGSTYDVVTKVVYDGVWYEFTYGYVYENVPYITNVKTNDDEYSLAYLNDKVITKTRSDRIETFIYSSMGNLLGMIVGKMVDDEFVSMPVAFVTDGFGNVIQANYLDVQVDGGDVSLDVKKIYEQQFDCIGHKVFCNYYKDGFDTNIGFCGALSFDSIQLVYNKGNLYSPLTSDYIFQPNHDDMSKRVFETKNKKRIDPTLGSVQKSVAIESLQNEINLKLGTSSVTGMEVMSNEFCIGSADVFTLPVAVDQNNIMKNPSKIAFVANLDNKTELDGYKNLLKNYFDNKSATYVALDEYYLASPLDSDLNFQFIFKGKLFTVSLVQAGLYGYTAKSDYSNKDYLNDKNIINYDSGRYVRYFESTLISDEYIDEMAFLTNFSSTEELDEFFENLGFINTTMGETYKNINFGDNTAYLQTLLQNTSDLNLPEYDKEKQYLSLDENGNYVIKDIPADAKVEYDGTNDIRAGHIKLIRGLLFIVQGVFLVMSCGTLSIICGVITLIGGLVVTICGVAQIKKGYTGESWIIDQVLKGDKQLLETISSVASTVATVAAIIGSIAYKSCFVEGTQVCTSNGNKSIEDINVGDYVLSFDEKTGKQSYNKVLDTYSRSVDKLCEVTVGSTVITSTLNHPYFVEGEWVEASKLKAGDKVLLSNNSVEEVKRVNTIDSPDTTVYNLNVESDHTYYAEDVLVHNTCNPKEFTSSETDELFKSKEYQSAIEQMKSKYPGVDFANKKEAGKFWNSHRREFNKFFGKKLMDNPVLADKIANIQKMINDGVNPKLYINVNGKSVLTNIQYHHFYGKLDGNMFNIYPMIKQKHMLFHNMFGRNDPTQWTELAKHIMSLLK